MRWFLMMLCALGAAALKTEAATAAFAGEVTEVQDAPAKHQDTLKIFTVKFSYLDYISRGKFGKQTKVGESMPHPIRKRGSVCMLNGRLTNAPTFAAAIQTGMWGYVYESTWINLYTTPNFRWGEVVGHDATAKTIKLREHYTHKTTVHLEANPPKEFDVPYAGDTAFRLEEKESDAPGVLKSGHWIQIHKPRPQMIDVRTSNAAWHHQEQFPAEEGKRGYANDHTAAAILKSFKTKTPDGVIDQAVIIDVKRHFRGQWEDASINAKKTTFVLDGKPAPITIAARPGRHMVLGHYRKETYPHKIFVQSMDDSVHGTVQSANNDAIVISATDWAGKPSQIKLAVQKDAVVWLNGKPSSSDALKPGVSVVVYPKRGATIIGFGKNGS